MAGLSPTVLSLRHVRANGYPLAEVVEVWNPHVRIRQDHLGIIDILAYGPDDTLAVQCTSAGGFSARVKKLTEHPNTRPFLAAGARRRIEVHGWAKVRNRWELVKRKEFVLGDGGGIARTGDDE